MATRKDQRQFGKARQKQSGRWQASFQYNDKRYYAPRMFDTEKEALAFLRGMKVDLERGWKPIPKVTPITFAEYVPIFFATQLGPQGRPLADKTIESYESVFGRLTGELDGLPLAEIDESTIERWYNGLPVKKDGKVAAARNANAYGAVKTLFNSAIRRKVIPGPDPCKVRGAGTKIREIVVTVAADSEIARIYELLPGKYRLMALLCSWLGLRMGEVTELRRVDVDFSRGVLHVHRGVTHTKKHGCKVAQTKGRRKVDMALLPNLIAPLREHLEVYAESEADGGRLFVPTMGGCHVVASSIYTVFYPAREAIGRPDLRFHDLRHTAIVRLAEEGATAAELMEFGRHKSLSASARYQSVANGRMTHLMDRLAKRAAS